MTYKSPFSFYRAINSLLKRGSLLDAEESFDAEVRRRIESTEALRSVCGSGLPAGARSFFCPINFAHRAVTTAPGSGGGIVDKSYLQFSDLLSYWRLEQLLSSRKRRSTAMSWPDIKTCQVLKNFTHCGRELFAFDRYKGIAGDVVSSKPRKPKSCKPKDLFRLTPRLIGSKSANIRLGNHGSQSG
jgi:hypothetical protein